MPVIYPTTVSGNRRSKFVYRMACIVLLSGLLWLIGCLALPSSVPHIQSKAQSHPRPIPAKQSFITPIVTASQIITPVVRTKPAHQSRASRHVDQLSPIAPFPLYFRQQVALLEANGRLLYHGNTNLREVALTFDDGPNPPFTLQILAILHRYHVHATFFCIGSNVQNYPAVVRQEFQEGHLVGNHSWSHPYLPGLLGPSVDWQLTATSDLIQNIIGVRPAFFRPPYGSYNSTVLNYANKHALTTVLWNDDPADWSMPGVSTIVNRALGEAAYGSIILMHDGGGNRWQTVAALPVIISWLQIHGYRLVTLQQLQNDLHPARVYSRQTISLLGPAPIALWRRNL